MKRIAIAAMLLLLVIPTGGQAATPNQVVVSVNAPDATTMALVQHYDATLVKAGDGLNPAERRTIKQRGVDEAWVVGQNTSRVVDRLVDLGITVHEIEGDSQADTAYDASIRTWDASNIALVTNDSDLAAIAAHHQSVPVFSSETRDADIDAALDSLGVDTVWVTPSVSADTRESLNGSGRSVTETVDGVSLDQSAPAVAAGLFEDSSTVTVTTDPVEAQTGGLLVAESPTEVGNNTTDALENASNTSTVLVSGTNTPDVNATSEPINQFNQLRIGLFLVDYDQPLVVSAVENEGSQYTVDLTNIGWSTVPVEGDSSIRAEWDGEIDSSTPDGSYIRGSYVVTFDDAVTPGESVSVELEADRISDEGHPRLEYYTGGSSGLVSAQSDLDLGDAVHSAPAWLVVFFLLSASVLATLGIRRAAIIIIQR